MIFTFILSFISSVIGVFTFFLPSVTTLPYGIDSSLYTVFGLYKAASTMFPFLATAMTYIILGMGIEISYKTYQIIMRFVNLLRGSG